MSAIFLKQSSDSAFEMCAPDETRVEIKLKVPIRDQLSEVIEVYGQVDGKGNIICTNYTTFDDSLIGNFGNFLTF
jgi:hypothetical protein